MTVLKNTENNNKMLSESISISPQTIIICITGVSGSGKTTMIKLMNKYLPVSYIITKDNEMIKIQNPDEFEKKYGVLVNTDNVLDYFHEVAVSTTKIDVANAFTDIVTEKIFLNLVAVFLEKKYEEKLANILRETQPQYIILEWVSLPIFKIWNKANYRIIVKPANWDLLVEHVKKRGNIITVTPDIAKTRYLATMEMIDNAVNITYEVINNYDYKYEQVIKNLCNEIVNTCKIKNIAI